MSNLIYILMTITFSLITLSRGDVDYATISYVSLDDSNHRYLTDQKTPDFGGKKGLADSTDLSKHKNRIKNIGVRFFSQDSVSLFKQEKSWEETYSYDKSVGYHWFGKSYKGLWTMNMMVKEYIGINQSTWIVG
jgi:hypothetical protein